MRTCTMCQTSCEDKQACAKCVADFPNRKDAATMTIDERIKELRLRLGVLETPFSMAHQRIEELVGRSVWTHELGSLETLVEEIRSGKPATMLDIGIEKIPAKKTNRGYGMTEAELVALAAIVQRETAEMVAENSERVANGFAPAYSDFDTDANRALRRELEKRKIF